MNRELIFILGGARAGKSAYAENLARERGGDDVLYIATAEGLDDEMRARIIKHRNSRPSAWRTLEAPSLLDAPLAEATGGVSVVVLDCLTLLVSNALLACGGGEFLPGGDGVQVHEAQVGAEVTRLVDAYAEGSATWIVVGNEVGLGIVPDNPVARAYRDALGRANQRVAAAADRVILLVAGLPLQLK